MSAHHKKHSAHASSPATATITSNLAPYREHTVTKLAQTLGGGGGAGSSENVQQVSE